MSKAKRVLFKDDPGQIKRLNRLSDEGERLESQIKRHRVRLDAVLKEIKAGRQKSIRPRKSI